MTADHVSESAPESAFGSGPLRYLVTGGGGFLGAAIVKLLRARGDAVTSFSRGDYPALAEVGAAQIRGDLSDPQAVLDACEDIDVVIHVAAKPPPWGTAAAYDAINVTGTENVINACIEHGIATLVYTSSPSATAGEGDVAGGDESLPYGTHFFGSEYARSKAEGERLVLSADGRTLQDSKGTLRTVALRPHIIWGPGDPHFLPRFVEKKRAGQLKRIGKEDPQVDTTYIDNAADAHLLAADKLREGADVGGKAYFITNDERIGLWTMLDKMLDAAGEGPVEGSIPLPVAKVVAAVSEAVWKLFKLKSEPRITRFVVHQVSSTHWYDISAAKRDLGYVPKVSTQEGLQRLKVWYAAKG